MILTKYHQNIYSESRYNYMFFHSHKIIIERTIVTTHFNLQFHLFIYMTKLLFYSILSYFLWNNTNFFLLSHHQLLSGNFQNHLHVLQKSYPISHFFTQNFWNNSSVQGIFINDVCL